MKSIEDCGHSSSWTMVFYAISISQRKKTTSNSVGTGHILGASSLFLWFAKSTSAQPKRIATVAGWWKTAFLDLAQEAEWVSSFFLVCPVKKANDHPHWEEQNSPQTRLSPRSFLPVCSTLIVHEMSWARFFFSFIFSSLHLFFAAGKCDNGNGGSWFRQLIFTPGALKIISDSRCNFGRLWCKLWRSREGCWKSIELLSKYSPCNQKKWDF